MSQYFVAPRPLSLTRSEPLSSPVIEVPDLDTDIDRSIYIFPSPALGPQSPTLSSLDGSTPTDMTLPSDIVSDGSRRASSLVSWGGFSASSGRPRGSSVATGTNSEPDVEIWGWPGDDIEVSDLTEQELEAAVERANRWEMMDRRPLTGLFTGEAQGRARIQQPLRPPSFSLSWDGNNRARTLSNPSRTSSRPPPPVSYPFVRIPFITFFASLLSLDDATLQLITRPTLPASSPLFSGPVLSNHDELQANEERVHGVARLCEPHTGVLKEGVGFACDSSAIPFNPFAIHLPSFPDIPRFVRHVSKISRKTIHEARRPQHSLAVMT